MSPRRAQLALGAIVVAMLAVRVAVARTGGQLWSQDEAHLWSPGFAAAGALYGGPVAARLGEAATNLLSQQAHAGYRPITFVLGWLGFLTVGFGHGMWPFAVLNALAVPLLALVVATGVRRLGGTRDTAVVAAAFLATAVMLTQWAGHLLPYDWGLLLDWVALVVALTPGGVGRGAAVGALACYGFVTYLGYGATAGLALAVGSLTALRARRPAMLGGLALGVFVVAVSFQALPWPSVGFWEQQRRFLVGARLESWGSSYAEGPAVPLLYGLATEGPALLLLLAAAVAGLTTPLGRRAVAGGVLLYLSLASGAWAQTAVVVGRSCRQLWPWLAIAAAAGVTARRQNPWPVVAVVTALYLWNLQPLLAMRFPSAERARWEAAHGPVRPVLAIAGPAITPGDGDPASRFVAVNVAPSGVLWPVETRQPVSLAPGARLLARVPHPLAWPGLWFEGFTPVGREALAGLTMELWEEPAAVAALEKNR